MNASRWKIVRRYSLRTLFVLMTLCCILFGAWSVYVNPYRMQVRSLAAVNRLQGTVTKAQAAGPAWQAWLVTTMLGDDTFVRVTEVDLNNKTVSDDNLRELAGLVYLQKLLLDHTAVTDASMPVLRTLPELQHVSLRYTNVTDRSVPLLGQLPNLQTAYFTGTKITDAGIESLTANSQMKELYIRWTGITDAGAERSAAAMPNCAVHHHALIQP